MMVFLSKEEQKNNTIFYLNPKLFQNPKFFLGLFFVPCLSLCCVGCVGTPLIKTARDTRETHVIINNTQKKKKKKKTQ